MSSITVLMERYPVLRPCEADVRRAFDMIVQSYRLGGKVLVCGNGGSCSDADHIVGELMKGFCKKRPLPPELCRQFRDVGGEWGEHIAGQLQQPLRAINLCGHTSLSTAFNNDVDPVLTYAQQTLGYADKGDILIGISTSGNAQNVLAAAVTAKAIGTSSIGLCGAAPCKMDGLFDCVIHVPEKETYKIQELHLPVYHALCLAVEDQFFEE